MSGKGKRYEIETVNACTAQTTDDVWVTRPDFSGNSKYAFADMVLVWQGFSNAVCHGAFIELKKRSPGNGNRASDTLAGSKDGQSGLEELEELIEKTPPWGVPYVGVKFPNRELIVYSAMSLRSRLQEGVTDDIVGEPQLTPSNNISIRKPTLDDWRSATSGDSDVNVILQRCNVAKEYWEVNDD